jgi:hypothetical protein
MSAQPTLPGAPALPDEDAVSAVLQPSGRRRQLPPDAAAVATTTQARARSIERGDSAIPRDVPLPGATDATGGPDFGPTNGGRQPPAGGLSDAPFPEPSTAGATSSAAAGGAGAGVAPQPMRVKRPDAPPPPEAFGAFHGQMALRDGRKTRVPKGAAPGKRKPPPVGGSDPIDGTPAGEAAPPPDPEPPTTVAADIVSDDGHLNAGDNDDEAASLDAALAPEAVQTEAAASEAALRSAAAEAALRSLEEERQRAAAAAFLPPPPAVPPPPVALTDNAVPRGRMEVQLLAAVGLGPAFPASAAGRLVAMSVRFRLDLGPANRVDIAAASTPAQVTASPEPLDLEALGVPPVQLANGSVIPLPPPLMDDAEKLLPGPPWLIYSVWVGAPARSRGKDECVAEGRIDASALFTYDGEAQE